MKEIQTNGITILLVEVPEDAKLLQITQNAYGRNLSYKVNNTPHPFGYTHIKLPEGQYQILGKSTELSEEQMKEIITLYEGKKYKVYTGSYGKYTDKVQESYLSLLEANGIVDRNNLTNPDTTSILGSSPSGIDYEILDELRDKWQKSQSKVKHYLVLKRL